MTWRNRPLHRRAASVTLLALAGACSVADNLSSDEILNEMDAIVIPEANAAEPRIRYAEQAPVSSWYVRAWFTQPIRPLLTFVFGHDTVSELPHAAEHVRTLMAELPDEVGDDLEAGALASSRLARIAQLERNTFGRLIALDAMAAIAQRLQLPVFPDDLAEVGLAMPPAQVALAVAGVRAGRPAARGDGPWPPAMQQAYREALAQWTERPLSTTESTIVLVEELSELFRTETCDAVRDGVAAALRAAMGHMFAGMLLRTVHGREPELVELRLCAMEHVRRFAGPRGVALLLAAMAATPEQVRANAPRYDPDDLVRLRLIHYCGQLRGELATRALQLPTRQAWEAVAPADFLATTILQADQLYSKLRTPAVVALTWSLGRPRIDPDPTWVREWLEGRQRGSP